MAKALNMSAEMLDDSTTFTKSNRLIGIMFRVLNAQPENGGTKNMFDLKTIVFRAYERWG